MLGREYDTQVCSLARALEIIGERWTLLIIRNLWLGVRRFEELQGNLGVSRPCSADGSTTFSPTA